jgi:hypothetical protein
MNLLKLNMKKLFYLLSFLTITGFMTSCATIIGGSNYWAKVKVPNHPNAKIEYQKYYQGTGQALFKVKRSEANSFSVTIKEEGCETETKNFTKKSFRGWSFVGTVVVWTGLSVNGAWLPIPFGVIIDASTGAWWKPNINEKGVSKEDYKNFTYTIDYTGCKNKTQTVINQYNDSDSKAKTDKLIYLKKLFDDGVITSEELEAERKKILEE